MPCGFESKASYFSIGTFLRMSADSSALSKCLLVSARIRARSQVWKSSLGGAAVCVRCMKRHWLRWKYCQYQLASMVSRTGWISSGASPSTFCSLKIRSSGLFPSMFASRAIRLVKARTYSAWSFPCSVDFSMSFKCLIAVFGRPFLSASETFFHRSSRGGAGRTDMKTVTRAMNAAIFFIKN